MSSPAAASAHLAALPERLAAVVRADPDRAALICPPARAGRPVRTLSFAELEQEADVLARGLLAAGIGPGTRTALLVTPGPEFLALAFAMSKVGAVPVVVDPGLGRGRLGACLNRAEPEAFIGVPRAHMARLALGWARRTVQTTVVVGGPRPLADHTLDGLRAAAGTVDALPEVADDAPGMVAFTSGSTGIPKGVLYRRDQLATQLAAVEHVFGWRAGDVDLPTMPMFALFGAALGVTVVLPDMDFTRPAKVDPAMLARLVRDYRVTSMFGSPALLNTLSRWAEANDVRLESLRTLISAGAPVPPELLRRCRAMLAEDADIFTPYGATEALPSTTIESREILGETAAETDRGAGVCVGRPVAGAEIEIVAVAEGPIASWQEARVLPTGEIGEIAVRAPWVSAAYLNDEANTSKAKVPVSDGSFFHRIGDVGYRDAKGRIWFCGRVTQRVVTDTGTLFTIPCEGVFNTHPAVFRSALLGPRVAGRVRPTICVELERGEHDTAELYEELLRLGAAHEHTRAIRDVLVHPGFPVDIRHNAKIERETLAAWAQERLG